MALREGRLHQGRELKGEVPFLAESKQIYLEKQGNMEDRTCEMGEGNRGESESSKRKKPSYWGK